MEDQAIVFSIGGVYGKAKENPAFISQESCLWFQYVEPADLVIAGGLKHQDL